MDSTHEAPHQLLRGGKVRLARRALGGGFATSIRCRPQDGGAVRGCSLEIERKSRNFFSFYCRLSEVVKNSGLLCRKVTLKCFCYVTLGLAACSMDL